MQELFQKKQVTSTILRQGRIGYIKLPLNLTDHPGVNQPLPDPLKNDILEINFYYAVEHFLKY